MSQMTDHAVQWDTLLQDDMQESQSVALLDPLSDTTDTLSNGQQVRM
jgi:hypothetical protein